MEMNQTFVTNSTLNQELNLNQNSIDFIWITNVNYIKMFENLENILKSFDCYDQLAIFKTYQSLILDDNLKFFNLNNFLSLFQPNKSQITKSHLDKQLEYISFIILEILQDKEKKEEAKSHYMDILCSIEVNYLAISTFFKINNFQNPIFYDNNSPDENSAMIDLMNLSKLNNLYEKFFENFLNFVNEYNLKVRNKEFFMVFMEVDRKLFELTGIKIVFNHLEFILTPIFLSLKYILGPLNILLEVDLKINLQKFNHVTKTLFKIIFSYMMIYYKPYETTILNKISNFQSFEDYLLFNTIICNYICEMKYKEKENLLDYHTFFPNFADWFWIDFMAIFKQKLIKKTEEFLFILTIISKYDLKKFDQYYMEPRLFNQSNEAMKDFLVNHFVSSFLNDNNYEVVIRNFWLKSAIECYCYSSFLYNFFKIIASHLQNRTGGRLPDKSLVLLDIQGQFENIFERMAIILPKKLMLVKDVFNLTFLIMFHHFALRFPTLTFTNKIIDVLKDLSLCQNRYYFFICNHLLDSKHISSEAKLRIYSNPTFPLEYHEITSIHFKGNEVKPDDINNMNIRLSNFDLISSNKKSNDNQKILNYEDGLVDCQMVSDTNDENFNSNNMDNSQSKQTPQNDKIKNSITKKRSSTAYSKDHGGYNNIQTLEKHKKNSISKSSKKKNNLFPTKFDVTALISNIEEEQIKTLENKFTKKIKFTKNKKGLTMLKCKEDSTPLLLIQKDNIAELIFHNLNCRNLKESLNHNYDMINRGDLDYLMVINLDILNQNLNEQGDNFEYSVRNYSNIMKYYDIKEKLDYYSVVENLIRMFD